MKVYYQLFKYNKEEKLLRKYKRRRSRSFIRQFIDLFYRRVASISTHPVTLYTGSVSTVGGLAYLYCVHCGRDSTVYEPSSVADRQGIMIGTGTNAVDPSDYKLQTRITKGTGSGEMLFYGTWGCNFTSDSSEGSFDIESIYANASGGDITINEIGIYAMAYTHSYVIPYIACIIRDVLDTPITISDGELLKIKYTITMEI